MAVNRTELTTWDVGVAIKRNNPLPLDSTENQSSKEALEEYAKGNGERGAVSYVGLIVKVVEGDTVTGCYIIKNTLGELMELSTKSLLNDAISGLGPVFTFKGVATAIDPDHTTLTIGKGTVSGAIEIAPALTSFNDLPLVSYGTVLSENLESVMYAWGTPEYGILFYTEKPYTKDNPAQPLFDKSTEESELKYIDVYDTLYFYSGSVGIEYSAGNDAEGNPTTATRIYTVWEAINNGGTLYSISGSIGIIDIYATTSSDPTLPNPLKTVTVLNYKYWEFTKLEENKFTVAISSDITTETAKPENNGHVYQLREEEYASNGLMWVQLGSPKNDWIVL